MTDEVERILREDAEKAAAEKETVARAKDGRAPAGSPSDVVN